MPPTQQLPYPCLPYQAMLGLLSSALHNMTAQLS
ncbi:CRISPR-associated protein Cas5 [Veillonella magna]